MKKKINKQKRAIKKEGLDYSDVIKQKLLQNALKKLN